MEWMKYIKRVKGNANCINGNKWDLSWANFFFRNKDNVKCY